jgi:hypothetical protein
MTSTLQRYQRIVPLYDLLDLPFEYRRYRRIRPLLFDSLSGRILNGRIWRSGVWSAYSPPIRAPFSATERFISSTTNTSATMTTASTQNTSK